MIHKRSFLALIAGAIFSAAALTVPLPAEADDYGRYGRWSSNDRSWDRRHDWGGLRRERAELQRDLAELERDRADLRRMYRYGASQAAIDRKKEEIRRDLREVRESQREIREEYSDLRQDRYGSGGWYNSPWWGWGNGWGYRR
jgi:hypothetical protein